MGILPTVGSLLNQKIIVVKPKKTPHKMGKSIFKNSVELEETFTGLGFAMAKFLAKIERSEGNVNEKVNYLSFLRNCCINMGIR